MSGIKTFEGDMLLRIDDEGDADIVLTNGQPEMTEFFDTTVMMYIYGVDSWFNATTEEESEQMKSRFPEFLETANVRDETIAEGRVYLLEALAPLKTEGYVEDISVDGDIISVYGIRWTIEMTRKSGGLVRYAILWDRGFSSLEALEAA